jgi:cysteine desulfurase
MPPMPVYLDYNATVPLRPEAFAVMQELLPLALNASSVHSYGREAKKHLEAARHLLAETVSAWPDEVIFTGSGTEANNTALHEFPENNIAISSIEHSSVMKAAPNATLIPVTSGGVVDLSALSALLKTQDSLKLVSVMLANNETGVVQPIGEISELCKKHEALLHCDAAQALGKLPVDFGKLGADFLTISSHKCGGPIGAAALVVRRNVRYAPMLVGGGQESNRRAGTENIAAIAGFAKAVEIIDFDHMRQLRGWLDEMENVILSGSRQAGVEGSLRSLDSRRVARDDNIIFGKDVPRLPNTSCIAMPGFSNEVQLMNFDLQGFAISAGSACSSGRIEASHVLTAMGASDTLASCAIRVSGGWATTEQEIQQFLDVWVGLRERARSA